MKKNYLSVIATHLVLVGLTSVFTPVLAQADLGALQKESKPIRYVALGGSLSAGVRDGGINQQSQVTSFPNLLAKQMGIVNFRQPLFEGPYKSGTGTISASVKNGKLQFFNVSESIFAREDKLPKVVNMIDNMAIPYLKARELVVAENQPGAFLDFFDKTSYRHLDRYVDTKEDGKSSYAKVLQKKLEKADFFTWELGMDDFTDYYSKGAFGQQISYVTADREGIYPENDLLKYLVANGAKGVIANVPEVLDFPYYKFYTYKSITERSGKEIYVQRYGKNDVRLLDPRDILLPTEDVAGLLTSISEAGRSLHNPLRDEDVLGFEEQTSVGTYNQWVAGFAKNNGLPLVDLQGLYKRILEGGYVSHDGVKIDPSYPSGNFFSADGIHPSAIGQGVVANEFITAINTHYDSKIPLINISGIR